MPKLEIISTNNRIDLIKMFSFAGIWGRGERRSTLVLLAPRVQRIYSQTVSVALALQLAKRREKNKNTGYQVESDGFTKK